ncbi:MAG: ATP-binding protein [Conexibacter sp.]|nr:ATP-binding protein [Conexibacter sp.]
MPLARHSVRDYLLAAETADPPLSDVGLVVSEAVSNVVLHAYPEGTGGEVRVRVAVDGAEVALVIADDGGGLRPRPDSPGLGMGLPLMAAVAQRLETRRTASGGNELRAWFSLAPEDATLS